MSLLRQARRWKEKAETLEREVHKLQEEIKQLKQDSWADSQIKSVWYAVFVELDLQSDSFLVFFGLLVVSINQIKSNQSFIQSLFFGLQLVSAPPPQKKNKQTQRWSDSWLH